MSKFDEIVESDRIDIETAMNILINAVQHHYNEFSDTDKFLIGKSLSTFKSYYESKEDIVIKFNKMKTKIYLAIPYSRYEEKSFKLANEIAAQLINMGHVVFSPISMSHPIAVHGNLKGDWETWKRIDFEFIKWCDEVVVVNFDEEAVANSTGVQGELEFAKELGKNIRYYYDRPRVENN